MTSAPVYETMNEIGFPGLTDYLIVLKSRVAFSIGSLDIAWYGILICLGIVSALFYFVRRGKRTELIEEDDLLNIALFVIPFAVIGARFMYVITNLDKFDNVLEVIGIGSGGLMGLAIYGGIIFGLATILIYCKIKHIRVWKVLDCAAPAVMLGQLIGRWGNFMNCECYGYSKNIDKIPWRMTINGTAVHPTFLYESLWNLTGFIIANVFYKKKRFDGQISLFYIAWYGFGRGFIELLRTDSCLVFGQKIFVYLGFTSCVAALTILFVKMKHHKKETDDLEEYKKQYTK